jgi:hypothetical protein
VEVTDQYTRFYRITALWAASECFLGGLLHGIKLPVTGLLLGSLAVLFTAIIAWHLERRLILKATLLVLIIKAALSPHTPLGAYMAVGFQGLMAFALLGGKHYFKARVLLLAILVLLQSAMQKLIMLTLVYGIAFWEALDEFLVFIGQKIWLENTPLLPIGLALYLGIYLLVGISVGLWAGKNVPKMHLKKQWAAVDSELKTHSKKKKKGVPLWWIIWLGMLIFYALEQFILAEPLFNGLLARLLLRGIVILGLWYLVLGPLLLRILRRYLSNKSHHLQGELAAIMQLLPGLKEEISRVWNASRLQHQRLRIWYFLRRLPKELL